MHDNTTLESVHQRLDRSAGQAIEDSYFSDSEHDYDYDSDNNQGLMRSEAKSLALIKTKHGYKKYKEIRNVLGGWENAPKNSNKGVDDSTVQNKWTRDLIMNKKEELEKHGVNADALAKLIHQSDDQLKASLKDAKKERKKNKKNKGGSGHGGTTIKEYTGRSDGLTRETTHHGESGHKQNKRGKTKSVKAIRATMFKKKGKKMEWETVQKMLMVPVRNDEDKVVRDKEGKIAMRDSGLTKEQFDHAYNFMEKAWNTAGEHAGEMVTYDDLKKKVMKSKLNLDEKGIDAVINHIKWSRNGGMHAEWGKTKIQKSNFNKEDQRRALYYVMVYNALLSYTKTQMKSFKIPRNASIVFDLSAAEDPTVNFAEGETPAEYIFHETANILRSVLQNKEREPQEIEPREDRLKRQLDQLKYLGHMEHTKDMPPVAADAA